jgi:signal transduction histidine kinase
MHDQGRIEIAAEARGTLVVLRFTDTGIGIAGELLPRIFEPNFSTKTEGMGLGLAIVKKIIDDAGGSIRIESAEGEGTSVIIELPAAQ